MLDQQTICLLVRRAGQTTIVPLEPTTTTFGYAPSASPGIVLFDGALENDHGEIRYRQPEPSASNQTGAENSTNPTGETQESQATTETHFWLQPKGPNIQLNRASLPARNDVSVQLSVGDTIHVGDKYLLIVSTTQVTSYSAEEGVTIRQPSGDVSTDWLDDICEPGDLFRKSSQIFLPRLPEIYQPTRPLDDRSLEFCTAEETFFSRFLALFESAFLPVSWVVENFDLFLHPQSAPPEMLDWLICWYGPPFDGKLWQSQGTPKKRKILCRLPKLLEQRGTVVGLLELLHLYTEQKPKIDALFGVDEGVATQLDQLQLDSSLVNLFKNHASPLTQQTKIQVIQAKKAWKIQDSSHGYQLVRENASINVFSTDHVTIRFPTQLREFEKREVLQLIETFKPAYTGYSLKS